MNRSLITHGALRESLTERSHREVEVEVEWRGSGNGGEGFSSLRRWLSLVEVKNQYQPNVTREATLALDSKR